MLVQQQARCRTERSGTEGWDLVLLTVKYKNHCYRKHIWKKTNLYISRLFRVFSWSFSELPKWQIFSRTSIAHYSQANNQLQGLPLYTYAHDTLPAWLGPCINISIPMKCAIFVLRPPTCSHLAPASTEDCTACRRDVIYNFHLVIHSF